MVVSNPKKNFNPFNDRRYIDVPESDSYTSRMAKIQGYETRLFFHFKYCKSEDGKVFNTTLTYNDKALHDFYGFKVPDAKDLRWLMHDSNFRKVLKKGYGIDHFDYFIGTELGEGKGVRGYHNNPHYHVIWFVFPSKDETEKIKFKNLTGDKFLRLVKRYWQGEYYFFKGNRYSYNEMMDKYEDSFEYQQSLSHPRLLLYQDCRYGMVSTGRYGCEVTSNSGMHTYCAKYACKNAAIVKRENDIRRVVYKISLEECENLYPSWDMESKQSEAAFQSEMAVRSFRTRYSTKVRCSQHLGEYGIKFIKNKMDPRVPYETSKGIQWRSLPQYLFRKVYRDRDKVTKTLVKNELGYKLQRYQLWHNVHRLQNKVVDAYKYCRALDPEYVLTFLPGVSI